MSKGVWMTADQVRRLTEGLVSIEDSASRAATTEAPAPRVRKIREAVAEAATLRQSLPDYDHLPGAGDFWEACRAAAWAVYTLRYAERMDGPAGLEPGEEVSTWSGRMTAKYGKDSTAWPLPGFPELRATLDVARLVGQCEAAWGWEHNQDSGKDDRLNFLVELEYAAEQATEREGAPGSWPDAPALADIIRRLCMGCMGLGSLDSDPRWAAWLDRQGLKPTPMDAIDFAWDWLPDALSDCGVPRIEGQEPTGQPAKHCPAF